MVEKSYSDYKVTHIKTTNQMKGRIAHDSTTISSRFLIRHSRVSRRLALCSAYAVLTVLQAKTLTTNIGE